MAFGPAFHSGLRPSLRGFAAQGAAIGGPGSTNPARRIETARDSLRARDPGHTGRRPSASILPVTRAQGALSSPDVHCDGLAAYQDAVAAMDLSVPKDAAEASEASEESDCSSLRPPPQQLVGHRIDQRRRDTVMPQSPPDPLYVAVLGQ